MTEADPKTSTGEFSQKERFDAYMRLADFRHDRFKQRQSFEWKLTVALWGLLAAAPIYLKATLPDALLAVILAAVVVAFIGLWTLPIVVRNTSDAEHMFYFHDRANRLLTPTGDPAPVPPEEFASVYSRSGLKRLPQAMRRVYAVWFIILTTVGLAVIAYVVITHANVPPGSGPDAARMASRSGASAAPACPAPLPASARVRAGR